LRIAGKQVDGDVTGLGYRLTKKGIEVCGTVRVTADGETILTRPLCYLIEYDDIERNAKAAGYAVESAWKRLIRWLKSRWPK